MTAVVQPFLAASMLEGMVLHCDPQPNGQMPHTHGLTSRAPYITTGYTHPVVLPLYTIFLCLHPDTSWANCCILAMLALSIYLISIPSRNQTWPACWTFPELITMIFPFRTCMYIDDFLICFALDHSIRTSLFDC